MINVYEKVPGGERPEYVLKNGKARNCYGLLIDVQELQAELSATKEILRLKQLECDELACDVQSLYRALEMKEKSASRSNDLAKSLTHMVDAVEELNYRISKTDQCQGLTGYVVQATRLLPSD